MKTLIIIVALYSMINSCGQKDSEKVSSERPSESYLDQEIETMWQQLDEVYRDEFGTEGGLRDSEIQTLIPAHNPKTSLKALESLEQVQRALDGMQKDINAIIIISSVAKQSANSPWVVISILRLGFLNATFRLLPHAFNLTKKLDDFESLFSEFEQKTYSIDSDIEMQQLEREYLKAVEDLIQ